MRVGAERHPNGRVAAPTARYGSVLEMIELARYMCASGAASTTGDSRKRCLRAAVGHRGALEAAHARDGLRSYVEHCTDPWPGLWPQVQRALGGRND